MHKPMIGTGIITMDDKWKSHFDGIESEMEAQRIREKEAYNHWLVGVTLAGLGITLLAIAALIWLVIQ